MEEAISNVMAAKEYADHGWKVLPLHTMKNNVCSCLNAKCASSAKHPRIKAWQQSCSNQYSDIEEWCGKWPEANIGLATGKASGFFVLDIDIHHGGKESIQELVKVNGNFPKTLILRTGSSIYHLFFRKPAIKIGNRANVLPGVNVRANSGYIVAPPSIHKSGARYTWMREFIGYPISDAPRWLLQIFFSRQFAKSAVQNGRSNFALTGGHNNFPTNEAGRLRSISLKNKLKEINHFRDALLLGDDEALAICAGVVLYPEGKVVQTPEAAKYSSANINVNRSTAKNDILVDVEQVLRFPNSHKKGTHRNLSLSRLKSARATKENLLFSSGIFDRD